MMTQDACLVDVAHQRPFVTFAFQAGVIVQSEHIGDTPTRCSEHHQDRQVRLVERLDVLVDLLQHILRDVLDTVPILASPNWRRKLWWVDLLKPARRRVLALDALQIAREALRRTYVVRDVRE
jgi:hypothetical protein